MKECDCAVGLKLHGDLDFNIDVQIVFKSDLILTEFSRTKLTQVVQSRLTCVFKYCPECGTKLEE